MSRPVADPLGHNKPAAPAVQAPSLAPAITIPDAPEHLGDIGVQVWNDVWAAGISVYRPETDSYVIERYASMQERRHHLMATLKAEGFLTVGSKGQNVAHPAARMLGEIESKLIALEDRLGLSPEARLRLGIAAVEHRSKLDAFLDEDGDEDDY